MMKRDYIVEGSAKGWNEIERIMASAGYEKIDIVGDSHHTKVYCGPGGRSEKFRLFTANPPLSINEIEEIKRHVTGLYRIEKM